MQRRKQKVPWGRRTKKATEALALLLRTNMTKAEALFWRHLKVRQKSWKHQFLPQQIVIGYIPDFYCEALKLAVEIDGRVHDRRDVKRNDVLRTRRLNKVGVTVLRFRNRDVFSEVHRLISMLERVCN
jgi:very-short-patch-repair endonuclease